MTWARTVFEQLDALLCAVFGGPQDSTISMQAAIAERDGRRWGCVLCWWLHQTLRQRHCERTLAGESMSGWAQASAAVQLALLAAVLAYGPLIILHGL